MSDDWTAWTKSLVVGMSGDTKKVGSDTLLFGYTDSVANGIVKNSSVLEWSEVVVCPEGEPCDTVPSSETSFDMVSWWCAMTFEWTMSCGVVDVDWGSHLSVLMSNVDGG